MNDDTLENATVALVETLVERDALEGLLKHPLLAALPRAEGYPVLGSYLLFAQLGSGGMANVFRGVHIRLENEVAIKIRTAPVGNAAARFQREATVAAKLEHQNLVRATDIDELSGLQYMVLDYIDGEDADERISRKGGLSPREALTIIRDCALGLAEAHRLDFVHRDIKPANVMISREGRVKLADLGLAKSVVDDDLGLTAAGGILGTPMYMAPEQFRRAEEVVKASDVYGLGVTLVFLLTGRHPFNGKSVPEIMQMVCVQGVARLDQTLPGLDPRIADLVAEIAALKTEDRPQDGAALAARMTEVLDAIGGPVSLADEEAGASKARGVNPPDRMARTRIKAALTRVDSGALPEASTLAADGSSSKLRWVAAAMLLAAGGGIGWSVLENQEGGAAGVIERLSGGESTPASPTEPRDPVTDTAVPLAPTYSYDPEPIHRFSALGEWDRGYAGLVTLAEEAQAAGELGAVIGTVEEFSEDFQGARRYKSTSGLLGESGQAALLKLADIVGTQAPWTSITAAELGVEFNGLLFEIDEALRKGTNNLLRMANKGDDEDAQARSKLLQGIMLVNDYFTAPLKITGQSAQDLLTETARAKPDSEAAAWLGLLYLSFLDRGDSLDDVPFWFETETMVELLRAAVKKTDSGDADSVMGHLSSAGLAGVTKSLEDAQRYYINGAKREHIGCVSDAILCGASLDRKLNAEHEEKILHFAESGSGKPQAHAREAYALAAITRSFGDDGKDAERFARAVTYLQANVDDELEGTLETDRQFNRVTLCLGAMMRGTELFGTPAQSDSRAWLEARSKGLARQLYRDGEFPPRSLPIWLLLAQFDPSMAKSVLVQAAGPGAEAMDVNELVGFFVQQIKPTDYADAPFVWSFVEPALAALDKR